MRIQQYQMRISINDTAKKIRFGSFQAVYDSSLRPGLHLQVVHHSQVVRWPACVGDEAP
jgi:hypothetical protein